MPGLNAGRYRKSVALRAGCRKGDAAKDCEGGQSHAQGVITPSIHRPAANTPELPVPRLFVRQDDTGQALEDLARADARVRPITLSRNLGHQAALNLWRRASGSNGLQGLQRKLLQILEQAGVCADWFVV